MNAMAENCETTLRRRYWVAHEAMFASFAQFPPSAPTRPLRSEQSPAHRVQIGQCCGDLKPVQVLGQPSIANLLEAKDPLDHPDRVFDLGADLRFGAVRGFDLLIDAAPPAIALVGV